MDRIKGDSCPRIDKTCQSNEARSKKKPPQNFSKMFALLIDLAIPLMDSLILLEGKRASCYIPTLGDLIIIFDAVRKNS
jgi:hypothetical protein